MVASPVRHTPPGFLPGHAAGLPVSCRFRIVRLNARTRFTNPEEKALPIPSIVTIVPARKAALHSAQRVQIRTGISFVVAAFPNVYAGGKVHAPLTSTYEREQHMEPLRG